MEEDNMEKILKIWKSMSLTSDPTDRYSLSQCALPDPNLKKTTKPSGTFKAGEEKTDVLPEPKINKINGSLFCVHLYNQLKVYKLPTPQERSFMSNQKKAFVEMTYNFDDNIKFVRGNNDDYIYVGFEHELRIFKGKYTTGINDDNKEVTYLKELEQIDQKVIPNLKAVSFFRKQSQYYYLIAISNDKMAKYNVLDGFKTIQQNSLKFVQPNEASEFAESKPIFMITEFQNTAYMFSSKVKDRKTEYLYISKFVMSTDVVDCKFSLIDRVFESGIFGKSKIFHIGPSVFLISLFQQIIVVKYHFEKYVVWDNISLAPSKSNEKKGQLVLADELVMVYTENGDIAAHNIYFHRDQAKLKCPNIDNFKGNDNDQEILYDAIVLQIDQKSFMKVLFYFKQLQVFYSPKNTTPVQNEKAQGDGKGNINLNFNILCIRQQEPVKKLKEYFKMKKTPQEINDLVKKFNVDDLTKSKCQWQVSDQTEKDIQFLLLQINDNEYIQEQLTGILKEKPHDLRFLKAIESKQINRYQKLLAHKLLKVGVTECDHKDPYDQKEREYIKKIIIWVMQSIMFKKKIIYSSNFLQFKEYDFIEIGKLKAASLKEEIKLLSEKGFEKRLKYFLNSFKYMALANFEDIFCFLIDDKNPQQVKDFFIKFFPFILPPFEETSEIFKKKNQYNMNSRLKGKNRQYLMRGHRDSFNPQALLPINFMSNLEQNLEQCKLWNGQIDENEIETKKKFISMIEAEISKEYAVHKVHHLGLNEDEAKKFFLQVFIEFVEEEWFQKNKSKQHSLIHITIKQLESVIKYLKTIGVFHFMVKIFQAKVLKEVYTKEQVNDILNAYVKAGLIPESFKANIDARRKVYNYVFTISLPSDFKMADITTFLIMEDTDFFKFLVTSLLKTHMLSKIKEQYDEIAKGFFREKFQVYLTSDSVQLPIIIDFFDQFHDNQNDDIRKDVFDCIKKRLRLDDRDNTKSFVNKLMDRQILKDEEAEQGEDELIDEAKVVFGYYFSEFLNHFNLDYTYGELIQFTKQPVLESNELLMGILTKYCSEEKDLKRKQMSESMDGEQKLQIEYTDYEEEVLINIEGGQGMEGLLQPINITQDAMNLFGILLLMMSNMKFKVNKVQLFDKFVELLLQNGKYTLLELFIHNIFVISGDFPDQHTFDEDKHTLLIYEFNQNECDVRDRITTCVIKWARAKYYKMKPLGYNSPTQQNNKFQNFFTQLQSAFAIFQESRLNLQNIEVSKEVSFLDMLKGIKKVCPKLVASIIKKRFEDYIIGQEDEQDTSEMMNDKTGFMFMIELLQDIVAMYENPNDLFEKEDQAAITGEIYEFQLIYGNFRHASKYKAPPSDIDEPYGLTRFNMELSLKLIEFKAFRYCFHTLLRVINTEYYFRNVFFEFLAHADLRLGQNGGMQRQTLTRFIQDFMAAGAKNTMSSKFKAFIKQNRIECFVESNKQTNSRIIFQSIVRSGRIDEAFYFLVRNNYLAIQSLIQQIGLFGNKDVESYALISIYVKCLKNYLCKKFYPTFSFYKNKHSLLTNEFERKDIIKDINIAISRMKQMTVSFQIEVNELEKTIKQGKIDKEDFRQDYEDVNDLTPEEKKQYEAQQTKKQMQILKAKLRERVMKKNNLLYHHEDLENIYKRFMQKNKLDPEIKLDELELKQVKQPQGNFDRLITTEQLQIDQNQKGNILKLHDTFEINNQESSDRRLHIQEDYGQPKRENKQLAEKKRKIQEKQGAKFLQMEKESQKFIRDFQRTNDQFQKRREELKKIEMPKDNFKVYEQLKEKQRQKIASVKSSHHSKASENVNKLLETLKQRRSRLYEKSPEGSRFSKIEIEESEFDKSKKYTPQDGLRPPQLSFYRRNDSSNPLGMTSYYSSQRGAPSHEAQQPSQTNQNQSNNQITNSRGYQVEIHGINGSMKKGFMPLTFDSKSDSRNAPDQHKNQAQNYIDSLKNRKGSFHLSSVASQKSFTTKLSLEEIKEMFADREPQCLKYIQKLGFVRTNLDVGVQITKSVYSSINGFDMFVKFLEYMFQSNPDYKNKLEYKAFQIASQAMGIEYKLNLKELFPIEFFTKIYEVTMKQYYKLAYECVRPNLQKILGRPDTNVHGLAVLFRYGFGSENTYYSLVYEDYIGVLLKEFDSKDFDDSKVYRIADKLRTLYSNVNAEGRDRRFERLLNTVSDKKRKVLINEMLKIIDKRKQMLTGDQGSDIRALLEKIK